MIAALSHRLSAKAALLVSSVAMLAAFAGLASTEAEAATFSFGCSPAPCIVEQTTARMNVQCLTTMNPNGTKTRNILAWITWTGLGSNQALDTTIAIANSAGFSARYGPYRLGYGQAISLGSSTVAGKTPAINVGVAVQFKLWTNGVARTAPWETPSHQTFFNNLPVTYGDMSYCTLF